METNLIPTVLAALAATLSLVACSDPSPNYGQPDWLQCQNLPNPNEPPGDNDAAPPATDAGGGDAGSEGSCAAQADSGCSVSWSNDIYPLMQANGSWDCAGSSCHASIDPPIIDPSSPCNAYASLAAYDVGQLPFIKAGATDPAATSFMCVLQGNCISGAQRMPQPPGSSPTQAELSKLQTWIGCGMPEN
jgi:hypothetical protein